MIDTNLIKDDPQRVLEALQSKNYDFNVGVSQEFYFKKNQIDYESLKNIK